MSWRHSRAVGELLLNRPPVKAVLLALAHHTNEYDGTCYPSIERLSLFTGLSRRSVQSALREAEALGLITTRLGGNRRASVYTLTLKDCEAVKQTSLTAQEVHPHSAGPAPPRAGPAPQLPSNIHKKDARAAEPVPDDWMPSELAIAQATKENPNVDIDLETRRFRDYNISHGICFANIGAGWRAWLARGEQLAGRTRPGLRAVSGGAADYLSTLEHGDSEARQHRRV